MLRMIFIHVGLAKTGTTALQSALRDVSAGTTAVRYLGDAGLWQPGYGFRPPTSRRETTRFERLIRDQTIVVLSSECLLGSLYDVYSKAEDRAASMRDFFDPLGPFKVIIYLRPQTQWLESAYVQRVKERSAVEADDFACTMLEKPNLAFASLVSDLNRALGPGRLVVRPYDSGIDVAMDFLELLGIDSPLRREGGRENISLSAPQVAVLRRLNEVVPSGDARMLNMRAVFQTMVQSESPRYSPFSKVTQRRIRDFTEWDWANLVDFMMVHDKEQASRFRTVLDDVKVDPIEEPLPMDLSTSVAQDEIVRVLVTARYREQELIQAVRPFWPRAARALRRLMLDPIGFVNEVRRRWRD